MKPDLQLSSGALVRSVPNWNGASVPAEGVWRFSFWWRPLSLRFTLNNDATVQPRLPMLDLISLETGILFQTHLDNGAGAAFTQAASTLRNYVLIPDLNRTSTDAVSQIVQAQMPMFIVGPYMGFRLSVLDLNAGDAVTNVRLFYERLPVN